MAAFFLNLLLKMVLTDTHTHLYLEQFDNDIDATIERAKDHNVHRIFLPNIDSSTTERMLQLTDNYPDVCFPMMGLHPCSVNENFQKEIEHIEQWLSKRKFYAIGEIGIDLYWDKTYLSQQQEAFRIQIDLAKKHQLPIVIHARESFEEIFEIVDEMNDENLTGIFHCFTGTEEQANHIINYKGFKLGIGGVVTFKKAGLDKTLENIDPKHLVLETDSPYLAPAPFRGKRNESAYTLHIAEKLSHIYNLEIDEIATITTQNSKDIFGI